MQAVSVAPLKKDVSGLLPPEGKTVRRRHKAGQHGIVNYAKSKQWELACSLVAQGLWTPTHFERTVVCNVVLGGLKGTGAWWAALRAS
eukprot:TRINITY_DN10889_c0_g2_i12.p2 TRINITY_DN10889_c0_g2~~TRINITY_DN10889_c0_g2_i12.p2  ORF type:complete len:101 (+),score=15.39 TRINITY_DN10889_c0_g2_i12:41-304(+)